LRAGRESSDRRRRILRAHPTLSFLAGLVALRWLSKWLESGRWYVFGVYCLVASAIVLWVG